MRRLHAFVTTLAFLGTLLGSSPAKEEPGSLRVTGVVVEVETARLVVQTPVGERITLIPLEDFTDRVQAGMQISAWYYVQGGVNVLHRLEFSSQDTSPPTAEPQVLNLRKVILLPSSSVPDAGGFFDAMEKYLQSQFGWYVAPRVLAEEIRKRAAKSSSALEAVNSETGEFDMTAYLSGQQELVSMLASETRVDAVLEVDIETVVAKVKRMVATWDGVQEVIGGKGARTIARLAIVPAKGEVAATTVVLRLWRPGGTLVWGARRGLAVLGVQEGMKSKLRYRPLSEYLQDSAGVQQWLADTFAPMAEFTSQSTNR